MRFIAFFFFLLLETMLFAQENSYFQQETHYRIQVKLNDQDHSVAGTVWLEYINHSPDTLPYLYFHLWGNAYKNRSTGYAQQEVRLGSTKFYYAEEEDLGYFTQIDFKTENSAPLSWTYDPQHPDIALVNLATPLLPGGRVEVEIPFELKIPASFSRLGHIGQSYQMTQWYPKPAVYDHKGWHPMPYLDMGEFYSEFGSFTVEITLPANYLVAATGVLETESEQEFLEARVAETVAFFRDQKPEKRPNSESTKLDTFPASSAEWKTLTYTANQVHDFAWFADKRFRVLKGQVALASGRTVDTWAFFTKLEDWLWEKGADYVGRAVQFYSEHVGEYPYPHATAIQGPLSAGGGMEYPMITIIGAAGSDKALDEVITHEVGHNWFYGILGSNERDHPWMDEGMNSYYEYRYMNQYYGSNSIADMLPPFIGKGLEGTLDELAYLVQARRGLDQACDTHSDAFTQGNYWIGAYSKPARMLELLENSLGTEAFDRAMKAYYDEWKFRHPYPEDFKRALEASTGQDMDWLLDRLLLSDDKTDYAIGKVKKEGDQLRVTVVNRGEVAAPLDIHFTGPSAQIVVPDAGFEGKKEFTAPANGVAEVEIDPNHFLYDLHRHNNDYRVKGLFHKAGSLRVKFPAGLDHSERFNLYLMPLAAWNNYDKTMLGLALHNISLPEKRVEFALAPLYSFVSNELRGLGRIDLNLVPDGSLIRTVRLRLAGQYFASNYNWQDDFYTRYYRLSPSLLFEFNKPNARPTQQSLQARAIVLGEETAQYDVEGNFIGQGFDNRVVYDLMYRAANNRALNPWNIAVGLEQQSFETPFFDRQSYLRATLEANAAYTYSRGRNLRVRLFAGLMPWHTARESGNILPGAFNLTGQGYASHDDYRYDEFYLGRNDNSGLWSRQLFIRDGGFKNTFGEPFAGQSGNSNDLLLAVNLRANLPKGVPLGRFLEPYFDIAWSSDARPIASDKDFADQLWWSGGISLNFGNNGLAVFFPIVHSQNLRDLYKQDGRDGFFNQVSFLVDIRKLDPKQLIGLINL